VFHWLVHNNWPQDNYYLAHSIPPFNLPTWGVFFIEETLSQEKRAPPNGEAFQNNNFRIIL
jgi:hypothetical protein